MKEGQSSIFNSVVLKTSERPVFVVEGEIDALSIMAVGGEAIGIGSTYNANQLIRLLEEQKPNNTLILALDNDDTGQQCADKLEIELTKRAIPFLRVNLYGTAVDANAALLEDRESLQEAVRTAVEMTQC